VPLQSILFPAKAGTTNNILHYNIVHKLKNMPPHPSLSPMWREEQGSLFLSPLGRGLR